MDNELLAFPPENTDFSEVSSLTKDELIIIRKMIQEYQQNHQKELNNFNHQSAVKPNVLFPPDEQVPVKQTTSNLFCEEVIMPSATGNSLFADDIPEKSDNNYTEMLDCFKNLDNVEKEVLKELKTIIASIEQAAVKQVVMAVVGLFPCKKYIRHGTSEQKLFVLKTLGDRFLESLAGVKFLERRKFLKIVAKYLSDVSENYNFIPMEGEPFNPVFHERVIGSSNGSIIREMRGFLVVAKGTNKIIFSGLVLS